MRIRFLTGTFIGALLLGLVVGSSSVRAQLATTFTTNTAVVAGGTLTLAVSGGPTITGTSISTCSATTPPPAATVTYSCASGLNAGTIVSETFSVAAGPISETVTYNANGPVSGFPAASS